MNGDEQDPTVVRRRPLGPARPHDWDGRRLKPGETFDGSLQIMALIGRGGTGEVYAARDRQDRYAIKLISAAMAADINQDEILRREVEALRQLKHPNIVKYEYRRDDSGTGVPYIAMELVEGRREPVEGDPESWRPHSLKDHLADEGALSATETLTLARHLVEGLGAAHREGVFHRDLSPNNILLRHGDLKQPVIIDFGIAKVQKGDEHTLVRGEFQGTCNYASPEHFSQAPKVAPSDFYCLGLVLAAAARGRPLDMGHKDPRTAAMLRQSPPRLDGVPHRLRPLLNWLLRPKASERPQSARELLALMDRGAFTIWLWRHRRRVGIVVAAMAVVGVAMSFLGLPGQEPVSDEKIDTRYTVAANGQPGAAGTSTPAPAVPAPTQRLPTETPKMRPPQPQPGETVPSSQSGKTPPPVGVAPAPTGPARAPDPVGPVILPEKPPPACASVHPDADKFAPEACELVDLLEMKKLVASPGRDGAVFPLTSPTIAAGQPLDIDLTGTTATARYLYVIGVSDDGLVRVRDSSGAFTGPYSERLSEGETSPGWVMLIVVTARSPLLPLAALATPDTPTGAANITQLTRVLQRIGTPAGRDPLATWTLVKIKP
ncbi:protein kinase domain-containing protein [Niveispirillum sp. KHB5.9]|uniref:serine/threonine protein kinase n=1 Tax=Niveispirillum sp. KHB5.9 TaxID=3400269 RepID=UPI003A8B08DD